MPTNQELFRIAVLDDYQNVALSMANWSVLDGQATVTVFNDHFPDTEAVVVACSLSTSSASCASARR